MLYSFNRISNVLRKDKCRETRKCLESFCVQEQNQPQINNVAEDGNNGEAMDVHEDYQNHPYQPPTLTSDQQQQQIEEALALMA